MGAKFPYYLLADSVDFRAKEQSLSAKPLTHVEFADDIQHGFVYERVQHITVKSIGNNPDIKEGVARGEIDPAIKRHADFETLLFGVLRRRGPQMIMDQRVIARLYHSRNSRADRDGSDVGMYAQPRDSNFHDIGRRTTFTDARVAALSRKYAQIFVAQRSAAEGHPVQLAFGRPEARDANDANIWLVQLFSKVPWIYNEAGGFNPGSTDRGVDGSGRRIPDGACLTTTDKEKYATGIANAIIAALS